MHTLVVRLTLLCHVSIASAALHLAQQGLLTNCSTDQSSSNFAVTLTVVVSMDLAVSGEHDDQQWLNMQEMSWIAGAHVASELFKQVLEPPSSELTEPYMR